MAGRWDPERETDLRHRRELYERRARSLRYGATEPGSRRHLAQVTARALADVAKPGRATLVLCSMLSVALVASSLGAPASRSTVAGAMALPVVLAIVIAGQFVQQARAGRRRQTARRLAEAERRLGEHG